MFAAQPTSVLLFESTHRHRIQGTVPMGLLQSLTGACRNARQIFQEAIV